MRLRGNECFNSLFEMLREVGLKGWRVHDLVSILYLRCGCDPQLADLVVEVFVSILYLRCLGQGAEGPGGVRDEEQAQFQFSI